MTKIINVLNNGNQYGAKVGEVMVNSFNVSPNTITADASPATIPDNELNVYDYWKVQRTAADTNEFDLPNNAAIGQVITIYCVTGFELRTELDTHLINNDADKGYKTTTGDVLTCVKINEDSATAHVWLVTSLTVLGAAVTVNATIAA